MLAALPGTVGDGGARTITNTGSGGATATQATRVGAAASAATLKRFLVGRRSARSPASTATPDGRTLFVGIQHPGEGGDVERADQPLAAEPGGQQHRAGRASAVVAITKNDGGVVGL